MGDGWDEKRDGICYSWHVESVGLSGVWDERADDGRGDARERDCRGDTDSNIRPRWDEGGDAADSLVSPTG